MRRLQPKLLPLALCAVLGCSVALPAAAQKTMSAEDEAIYRDMLKKMGADPGQATEARKSNDAARRWTDAKDGVIYYHIVGVFQGRANVVGDPNWIGYADVGDEVEIDLAWKLADVKLVGTPTFKNHKSTVVNLRNWEPKCQPPVLKGEYEHYELLGVKQGLSGSLELQVQTSYPVVEVVQQCSGAHKSIPAKKTVRPEEFSVPSPVMLSMPLPDSDALRVSADKKSMVRKKDGWTWTFTPSTRN